MNKKERRKIFKRKIPNKNRLIQKQNFLKKGLKNFQKKQNKKYKHSLQI